MKSALLKLKCVHSLPFPLASSSSSHPTACFLELFSCPMSSPGSQRPRSLISMGRLFSSTPHGTKRARRLGPAPRDTKGKLAPILSSCLAAKAFFPSSLLSREPDRPAILATGVKFPAFSGRPSISRVMLGKQLKEARDPQGLGVAFLCAARRGEVWWWWGEDPIYRALSCAIKAHVLGSCGRAGLLPKPMFGMAQVCNSKPGLWPSAELSLTPFTEPEP